MKLDVTRAEDWQKAVDSAVNAYGKLGVLINNAGILQMEGLEDIFLEVWEQVIAVKWEQVIAVKWTGVWLGMKAAIPALRKAGGGSIVNISSISGVVGTGTQTAYQHVKARCGLWPRRQPCDMRLRVFV